MREWVEEEDRWWKRNRNSCRMRRGEDIERARGDEVSRGEKSRKGTVSNEMRASLTDSESRFLDRGQTEFRLMWAVQENQGKTQHHHLCRALVGPYEMCQVWIEHLHHFPLRYKVWIDVEEILTNERLDYIFSGSKHFCTFGLQLCAIYRKAYRNI